MLRFYLRILWPPRSLLRNFWEAAKEFHGFGGVLVFLSTLVLFLSPELARTIESLEGLPRWWGLVPMAVLVVHGLAKTNYEKFALIEAAKQEAEIARQKEEVSSQRI